MHKNSRIKRTRDDNKIQTKKFGYYIPIIFIITIIPLIVYCKIVKLPKEVADFWLSDTHADFYSYYKFIALILGTLAALIAYGGLYLNGRLPLQKEKRYYIPMAIYSLLVILSTINAHNRQVALEGFPDMYQGVFVLLCYMVLMFIVLNYTRNEKDIRIIVYSFVILTILEGVLGIGQYFGYDFLQSDLGRSLITPKIIDASNLEFTFGKYTIYGTLFNTNFVGSFGALVLPLTMILYINEKNMKGSVLFGLAALLAFSIWLGCNSRAGYLGITSAFVLGLIVFRKNIKLHFKKLVILFGVFIGITFIFNAVSGGRVLNQFSRLNPANEAGDIQDIKARQDVRFEEVSIKDNTFTIKTDKETLIGTMRDQKLEFEDEDGNSLEVFTDDNRNIRFIDEKYSEYSFSINNKQSSIKAKIYGRNWKLYVTDNNELKVISNNDKLTDPVEAPRIRLFDGRETFASNRGYIWSRTIPMLKDALITGYGPDNYPMVFPQEDYVGRFNVGDEGMLNILVDKPHNMYLQTAVNTGVISLLALLAVWVIYLFDSFKLYLKGNIESFAQYMGAATFLSISAYLVAGLFNDNVISVAPLFWVLLGTGIGINRMIKTQD
jgi:hypothetical protein